MPKYRIHKLSGHWIFRWRDGYPQRKASWQEAINFANHLIRQDRKELQDSAGR